VEKITPSELQPFEASKEKAQQLATQDRQEKVMDEFLADIKKEIPYTVSPSAKKLPAPAAPGSN
jgi:hypothetical protein